MYSEAKDLLGALDLGRDWAEQEAVRRWRHLVGPALAALCRPMYVDRGVLHLAVSSPVVATELRLLEQELLARLSAGAPGSELRELRLHVVPAPFNPELPCPIPTSEEERQAEDLLPQNLFGPIREAMVRVVAGQLARDRVILSAGGRRCSRCGVVFLGEDDLCPLCRLSP